MKSILQSIKQQYCELIAAGKKTIEVRKTRPKLDVPFKVHIYETKGTYKASFETTDPCIAVPNGGKIISTENGYRVEYFVKGKGKVIGEYVCDDIEPKYCANGIATYYENEQGTCLSDAELQMYADGVKPLYFWHISDLKIYDKPKELSEFKVIDKSFLKSCSYRSRVYNNPDYTNGALLLGPYICNKDCVDPDFCKGQCAEVLKPLTHPPQSWCYVEEV